MRWSTPTSTERSAVPFDHEQAVELALVRRKCPWCDRWLRPCNMRQHVAHAHFYQLTIYDVLEPQEQAA